MVSGWIRTCCSTVNTIQVPNRVGRVVPGLRGFYNLGATCFMNSILQTIVHNPLMRAYYLGDQHNPSTCPHASAEMPCLACELTALLAEVGDAEI